SAGQRSAVSYQQRVRNQRGSPQFAAIRPTRAGQSTRSSARRRPPGTRPTAVETSKALLSSYLETITCPSTQPHPPTQEERMHPQIKFWPKFSTCLAASLVILPLGLQARGGSSSGQPAPAPPPIPAGATSQLLNLGLMTVVTDLVHLSGQP